MVRTSLIAIVVTAIAAAPALADAAADVTAAAEAYNAAAAAQDVETMLGFYAEDAVLAPPGGERIAGREAIEGYLAGLPGAGGEMSLELVAARAPGDGLAYSDSDTTLKAGDATIEGVDLLVWERGADGGWKIVYDIWTERLTR